MAYLTGYCYRIPIAIDHNQVGAQNLTDYPLYVPGRDDDFTRQLAAEYALSQKLGSARTGWAFTDPDGTTVLPFQQEYPLTTVDALAPTTFTADSTTDTLTSNAHGLNNGDAVLLTNSGGGLPAPLAISTYYFVVNKTNNTYQLADLRGGAAIDVTTNGSGTNQHNVLTMYWDAWVKPALISHVADTTIYLNFDHRAADTSTGYNATSTWNSACKGVWHLQQDPSGTPPQMTDSTANAHHGTTQGSMDSGDLVFGEIAEGLALTSTKYVDCGDNNDFTQAGGFTAECWSNISSGAVNGGFIDKYEASGLEFEWGISGADYWGWVYDSTNSAYVGRKKTAVGTSGFHHYAMTYDGGTTNSSVKLYVDGAAVDNADASSGSFSTIRNTAGTLRLGYGAGGLGAGSQTLDECRFSSGVQTADQLLFTYNNQANNSSTITFGAVQTSDQVNFDTASNSGYVTSASSTTFSVTCLGENRYVQYSIQVLAVGVSVSSVVRNSQTATAIQSKATVTALGTVYTFGQIAPTAGTYNVTVTLSGSAAAFGAVAVSRTGVDQTTPTENNANDQATNVGAADASVSVTTSTNADWIEFAVISDDGSITAISGDTQRANITGGVGSAFTGDYGPKATAGAQTVGCTSVGALATWAICANAIRPKSAEGAVADDLMPQICI